MHHALCGVARVGSDAALVNSDTPSGALLLRPLLSIIDARRSLDGQKVGGARSRHHGFASHGALALSGHQASTDEGCSTPINPPKARPASRDSRPT
jgi:hypothetical protein